MAIPDSLLILAGFVFAHAAWSVSDLPKGEHLVPLAVVETAGQRQLLRFEAETQEGAIIRGKASLRENEGSFDEWVFAREGQVLESGRYVDVLTIEGKAKGMTQSVIFVQRFQPFSTGQFKLVGEPVVSIGGKEIAPNESKQLIEKLYAGARTHTKAAKLWGHWISP
ncbi:hypothetical protein [Dyella sp.]|jgi:hypothetical protein|uniref:hypothetical protein n=1 Tax=Dyella sp. TaxID=1869338 RepID=UPI002D76A224|nr:hypothetical protein [Dyella sp.]HET6431572.1 hypothetical protein [Dyella sp.]